MTLKESAGSKVFDAANILFLSLFSLAALYPFWDILQTSMTDPGGLSPERKLDLVAWARTASLEMYEIVLRIDTIRQGFLNSFIQTFGATLIALFINTFAAYPLAKKRLVGRNYVTIYFTVTMFFSGGMIPTFLLVRSLGLYDSLWAIMVPGAFSVWYMIMMRTFFQNIPDELEEAAQMEGANDLYVLVKVYMPLSKALYATMSLFFIVEFWNSWFPALIYLQDRSLYPLQLLLRNLLFEPVGESASTSTPLVALLQGVGVYRNAPYNSPPVAVIFKSTIMVIATLPLIVIYPFVQKYFVKGIMVGSIKG